MSLLTGDHSGKERYEVESSVGIVVCEDQL